MSSEILKIFKKNLKKWPTDELVTALVENKPIKKSEDENLLELDLGRNTNDLTEEALEIEEEFRPIIKIRTRELRREIKVIRSCGGTLLRVLGDEQSLKESQKLCLQYILIWTKQLFPTRFIYLLFLVTCLTFFSLLAFTLKFPLNSVNTIAHPQFRGDFFFSLTIFSTLGIIGSILYLYLRIRKKRKEADPRIELEKTVEKDDTSEKEEIVQPHVIITSICFLIPEIFLLTTAGEYWYLWGKADAFPLLLPISAWSSLLIAYIALIAILGIYIRGSNSFIIKLLSHPMDYAPLFIYMKRNESNEWDIEGAQYDILHYKTKYVTKEQLFPKDEIETAKRPRFVINKVWHSFSKYEPPSIRILNRRNIDKITTSLFIIGILIVLAGLNAIYFIYSDKLFYNSPGTFIIQNAIFIFLLIYFIWHFDELREYNLDMWDALSSKNKKDLLKYHHLTYDKIRILWHLDKDFMITSPTTLKIRWKLQYPFRNYEKWDSFRDHIADIYQLCYPCNLNFDYDLFRFSNYNLDQTTKEQYQFNLQQMKKEVS